MELYNITISQVQKLEGRGKLTGRRVDTKLKKVESEQNVSLSCLEIAMSYLWVTNTEVAKESRSDRKRNMLFTAKNLLDNEILPGLAHFVKHLEYIRNIISDYKQNLYNIRDNAGDVQVAANFKALQACCKDVRTNCGDLVTLFSVIETQNSHKAVINKETLLQKYVKDNELQFKR